MFRFWRSGVFLTLKDIVLLGDHPFPRKRSDFTITTRAVTRNLSSFRGNLSQCKRTCSHTHPPRLHVDLSLLRGRTIRNVMMDETFSACRDFFHFHFLCRIFLYFTPPLPLPPPPPLITFLMVHPQE